MVHDAGEDGTLATFADAAPAEPETTALAERTHRTTAMPATVRRRLIYPV
jgi:hypothetical protein